MSVKIILVFVLALAYTEAQGNELCSCEPNDNKEERKLLSVLLEKLSSDVSDDEKLLYSVYPGLLNEFSCNCEDEKQRRKRKISPEMPEEVISEQIHPDPAYREKKSIHAKDRRCPKGHVRFAFTCVRIEQFDQDY